VTKGVSLLADAADFTVRAFDGVIRKGSGAPYVTHLFAVSALVGEFGGDEEQMAAALLHDYLEDIEGSSIDELSRRFGARVADIVLACSDTTTRPKPPWQERKDKHLAHLRQQTSEVRLVAACDKLHNATCLLLDATRDGDAAFDCFNASKERVLWYYRAAVSALGEGWQHPVLERLDGVVLTLERVAARG
jgi:(p)ppGpp synthase/HD superfamily hydrolase